MIAPGSAGFGFVCRSGEWPRLGRSCRYHIPETDREHVGLKIGQVLGILATTFDKQAPGVLSVLRDDPMLGIIRCSFQEAEPDEGNYRSVADRFLVALPLHDELPSSVPRSVTAGTS